MMSQKAQCRRPSLRMHQREYGRRHAYHVQCVVRSHHRSSRGQLVWVSDCRGAGEGSAVWREEKQLKDRFRTYFAALVLP